MALVIINRNAPDSHEVISLRRHLWEAQNIAQQIQRVNGNATDSDIETVYGIPQANVTAFKSVVDDLVLELESNAVEAYLGNIG